MPVNDGSDGLAEYGWSSHFQAQLSPSELDRYDAVRVLAVHRHALEVAGPAYTGRVQPMVAEESGLRATVGDWLLLEQVNHRPHIVLDRKSLFRRKAAGTEHSVQLIAANVDTLVVVSSCNEEFNLARLERYLVLAREALVAPVLVLTKADLAEDPERYAAQARRLSAGLMVETLDARNPAEVGRLRSWCGRGQTVALVGSSGVGKTTLVNTLLGRDEHATAETMAGSRGRHTTTVRSLIPIPGGGWLLDTPGMRELQIADAEAGIEDVFRDVVSIAPQCRYSNCRHENEPGCAVLAAVERGELDPARLARYRKLSAENRFNTETLAEGRARGRALGKQIRASQKQRHDRG